MTRSTRPVASRWAILVLTASALALAGCGRKGGLDLPPQAAATPMGTATPAPTPDNSAAAKGNALFAPSNGVDEGAPAATKGRKRSFVLDPILD